VNQFATSFRAIVYIGRENTLLMTVDELDPTTDVKTAMSWTGVTRMVLRLFEVTAGAVGDLVATVDTDVDATTIDFETDGELTFKLGDITKDAGGPMTAMVCAMRLTAFEGSTDTEIIHESSHDARLEFVATGG